MVVNKSTLSYKLILDNFVYVGLFALKSASRVLFLDTVGTFFVFKSVMHRGRSPPTINLDFKKIELIGGIKMDNRPKRFKEIDNPYTLESIEKDKLYFIKFRDEKGEHLVTVTKEVFDVFDESEKEDNKMMVRNSRYIHKYELSDEALNNKMLNNQTSIEDMLINDFEIEELYKAINELSDIQKRRIRKYFFEDKTFEEIAIEEECSKVAVKYTIDIALENISKKIKN